MSTSRLGINLHGRSAHTDAGDVPLQGRMAQEASTLTANWVEAVDARVGHTVVLHGQDHRPTQSDIGPQTTEPPTTEPSQLRGCPSQPTPFEGPAQKTRVEQVLRLQLATSKCDSGLTHKPSPCHTEFVAAGWTDNRHAPASAPPVLHSTTCRGQRPPDERPTCSTNPTCPCGIHAQQLTFPITSKLNSSTGGSCWRVIGWSV
jgi:hypothetical protein